MKWQALCRQKAPSGVLPPASTDAAILKEGKNLAEAPSAPTETLTDLSRKQAEYAEELADLGYYEGKTRSGPRRP